MFDQLVSFELFLKGSSILHARKNFQKILYAY